MLEHKTKWGFKESKMHKYMVSDDEMIHEGIFTDVY